MSQHAQLLSHDAKSSYLPAVSRPVSSTYSFSSRVQSAAPVIRQALREDALLQRSTKSHISGMSIAKNRDLLARIEEADPNILTQLRAVGGERDESFLTTVGSAKAGHSGGSPDDDNDKTDGPAEPTRNWEKMLSSPSSRPALKQKDSDGPKPRVFLNANKSPERLRISEVTTKVRQLRNDAAARKQFFEQVDTMRKTQIASRCSDSAASITIRNRMRARTATPDNQLRHLEDLCSSREERTQKYKLQREALQTQRRHKFLTLIARNRGEDFEGFTQADFRKHQQLQGSWTALLCIHMYPSNLHLAFLEAAERHKKEKELTSKQQAVMSARKKLCCIQRWWRLLRWGLRVRRKGQALGVIRTLLRHANRISVHFCVAVRLLRERVLRAQRHYRSVVIIRRLRRDYTIRRLDDLIRSEVDGIDKEIGRLSKEKTKTEAQHLAAIKSRKGAFEAQIKSIQMEMVQKVKEKSAFLAMKLSSKASIIEEPLVALEQQYGATLIEYGKVLRDRYLQQKGQLRKRKAREYQKALERQSIVSLKMFSVQDEQKLMMLKPKKPCMSLCIPTNDLRQLLCTTGRDLAIRDFLELSASLTNGERPNGGDDDVESSDREATAETPRTEEDVLM